MTNPARGGTTMDVTTQAPNNLVSEQAASLGEAVEEHSPSCYGAQQGSPSGWLDPPIERRFQSMEDMASSKSEESDMEEKSGDNRQREDMEWLSTLSEPELDFLISLKELASRRAKNVGYKDHDDKFNVRMLRGLGFILMEYVKEQVKSSSEIPDSGEMLRLLNESGLSTTNSRENSNKSSDGGTCDLNFVTPSRKRIRDGLCEGTTNCRKKLKTEVTND